jgi:rhodanese-related sulfurtransferase
MIRQALALSVLAFAVGCAPARETAGAPPVAAAAGSVRDIDISTLRAGRDAGTFPTVIDVRTPGEYAGGRIPGARNVPVDALDAHVPELLAAGGEVVLVCASGGRSARAAQMLSEQGVRAVNVLGGTNAWVAVGLAVER